MQQGQVIQCQVIPYQVIQYNVKKKGHQPFKKRLLKIICFMLEMNSSEPPSNLNKSDPEVLGTHDLLEDHAAFDSQQSPTE